MENVIIRKDEIRTIQLEDGAYEGEFASLYKGEIVLSKESAEQLIKTVEQSVQLIKNTGFAEQFMSGLERKGIKIGR
ncbi:hypothetical protein D3C77_680060 [compost metagenome]